jgi:hypothetical protein
VIRRYVDYPRQLGTLEMGGGMGTYSETLHFTGTVKSGGGSGGGYSGMLGNAYGTGPCGLGGSRFGNGTCMSIAPDEYFQ